LGQVHSIFRKLNDPSAHPGGQCLTGPFIGYEDQLCLLLPWKDGVGEVGKGPSDCDEDTAEKRLGFSESRGIVHASIERTDDEWRAQPGEQGRKTRRDRDWLVDDVNASFPDKLAK
jgi:hypothetical protein